MHETKGPNLSDLFPAARSGDRAAQEQIDSLIRQFARAVCFNREPDIDWEDVAQEASRRFYQSGLAQYHARGSERSYLYSIVKSTSINLARGSRRRRRREDTLDAIRAVPAHNPGTRIDLERILKKLADECRSVIERVFFYGDSYPELAAELGLAESSIRARLSRCLQKAREIARGLE